MYVFTETKLQPFLLIHEGEKRKCRCGALAVMARATQPPDADTLSVVEYCQECWQKEYEQEHALTDIKWQPVFMIINRRLECSCGALATIVDGTIPEDGKYNDLEDVSVWCQSCYQKMQEEAE